MNTITTTITDTEYKAMQYAASSPEEWIENLVRVRSKEAINSIVQLTVRYCLDNGLTIPSTEAEIVDFAFENGVVVKAADRIVGDTT